MIKLSRLADYAIVLMTQLAGRPSSLMQAPDLALVTGLPVPTVAKTLKQLVQAGLVESQRGAKGGYALIRDAANIPVTEIITAVDGPIALTDCLPIALPIFLPKFLQKFLPDFLPKVFRIYCKFVCRVSADCLNGFLADCVAEFLAKFASAIEVNKPPTAVDANGVQRLEITCRGGSPCVGASSM